ncbi:MULTISPECIES: thiamine ABC transporter permease [unclassified Vibrio]|uniref:ABC transporter permease n=1 Tax=unclassified Vibrio TaxID=2614977 RepID=UPI001483A448|nr:MULTISPECIES: thiamine ABC transporter permease [unclassified Vibrio]NNN43823.1 thiamine ABC transporter permease [Vibrio sp. 1-1(7)]NNN71647.1 thiamine ABC transporter permease [Vibrio sp. 12-2(3-a)]
MMLRFGYCSAIFICIAPIVPGVLGLVSSAFSFIPALGLNQINLTGFIELTQWAGLSHSLGLSISSALISTYLALAVSFAILSTFWNQKRWYRIENLLSILLAFPHVAFAIGFAFLFSPTGMVARLLHLITDDLMSTQNSTWLVHDPHALGLTLALTFKEVPFLLFMSLPILQQLNVSSLLSTGASLGYSPPQTWQKLIFPLWLSKMRFPLFAVICYGISVVDMSLILGPNTPPTFAVLVWQWFSDPDLQRLPRAAAGAMLLMFTAIAMLGVVTLIEYFLLKRYRRWMWSGRHKHWIAGQPLLIILANTFLLMIPIMLIWSLTQRWPFPALWPQQLSLQFWQLEWSTLVPILYNSIEIAFISGSLALVFALITHEYHLKAKSSIPTYILVLSLLIPPISLLFGLQIITLLFSAHSYRLWVIWGHLFFAFPFVYLALAGPWKSYPLNYNKIAASLGKTPWHIFWRIKIPLLIPAIGYAWAVGVSVSLAQYLPTLMLGAGRITTITTEAVTLSSGFDRRVIAIYALWQTLLPFFFFLLAIIVSRGYSYQRHIKHHRSKML